jgi:hypothetical protein
MEPRSFKRIASLSPAERIPFISEGLALLAQNVAELLQEAKFCWPEAPRASAITGSVAAEEAAKALMLVDYLRPPKGVEDARLSEHLGSVVDHVARGVYVESYEGRPMDFAEMRRFLDLVRQPYYLDGPTGYDWLFRNSIEAGREELFYVDAVHSGAGLEWLRPGATVELIKSVPSFAGHDPDVRRICTVLLDLHEAGLLQPEALKILRSLWAGVELDDSTGWQVYDALNREWVERSMVAGLVTGEEHLARIVEWLLFPLCGVRLRGFSHEERKRHRADLEQRQMNAASSE